MKHNHADMAPGERPNAVPSEFKYLLVASALFIAGVSAYFSVQGLGYLFAGSAVAVMVMAASLEVGKLVAASFLSRYWRQTTRVIQVYLVLAVLVLIAITSLGNYGYLARAYESTHTQIVLMESQIASHEQEIADLQRQIEGARGAVSKSTATEREDLAKLEQRLAAGNDSLAQAMGRLQDRRKAAQERRDRDVQAIAQRTTEQGEVLKKAIAIEESAIAALNDRTAALDRAGGPVLTVEEAAVTALNERLAALDRATGPVLSTEETAIAALNDRMAALNRAPAPVTTAEETAIAILNERVAVLDRAVDAYTKQGGPGFFKADSIKKGQVLREQQRPVREAIAGELAEHLSRIEQIRAGHAKELAKTRETITAGLAEQRARIEQLRLEHAKQQAKTREAILSDLTTQRARIEQIRAEHTKRQNLTREAITTELAELRARIAQLRAGYVKQVEAADRDVASMRSLFAQDMARLDTEEQEARKASLAASAELERQLATLRAQGQATVSGGDNHSQSLHQRIRSRNEDIHRLRTQIAAVDIGSYRYIARAFDATADGVVKWLMLALVLVFDPLAVSLVIGFNVALLGERPGTRTVAPGTGLESEAEADTVARPKGSAWAAGLTLLVLAVAAGVLLAGWGTKTLRTKSRTAHGSLIPDESFVVITLQPEEFSRATPGNKLADLLGKTGGSPAAEGLLKLITSGLAPGADLYAFAKFPVRTAATTNDQPVMLCGLVAQLSDTWAVEAALLGLADQLGQHQRSASNAAPSRVRNRAMIHHGTGRYLDPEGGFFSFAFTGQTVIVMLELEGNPKSPCIEDEIRLCLTPAAASPGLGTPTRERLPLRARTCDGAVSVWFDAGRFTRQLPKNAAAQARYQQLEKTLGFELRLVAQPAEGSQLNLIADYTYQTDRFKERLPVAPFQALAQLGPADAAGISGRLMDRCVDTLDYDSLIDRLRAVFEGAGGAGARQVRVEKSFTSERVARFIMEAQFDAQAGPPLWIATQTLFQ